MSSINHVTARDVPSRENKWKRSVVLITTYDNQDRPLLRGSGFFISPDRVATNSHVIKHAHRIEIKTFTNTTIDARTVVATDEKSDLAILEIPLKIAPDVLELSETPPADGDSITLIGNPKGSRWNLSHGRITQLWQFGDLGERIEITASVHPGSSGGPVINQQGRVIGIAVMHVVGGEDLNFAIPSESLRTFQTASGF